jgi:hypothetical protein
MKKKVLILGTSHSESSCRRAPGEKIDRLFGGRWHDYIRDEYNVETFNLSRSNCTVEQQFQVVWEYFSMNPDQRFDLCIIEGRSIEATVSIPMVKKIGRCVDEVDETDITPNEYVWDSWTDYWRMRSEKRVDDWTKDQFDRFEVMDSRYQEGDEHGMKYMYNPWYADYAHSALHSIHQWSSNIAMIKFLEKYCAHVKWYSFGTSKQFGDPDHEYNKLGRELLAEYSLFDHNDDTLFPQIRWDSSWDRDSGMRCDCEHYNEDGHRRFFYELIKPNIDKLNIL